MKKWSTEFFPVFLVLSYPSIKIFISYPLYCQEIEFDIEYHILYYLQTSNPLIISKNFKNWSGIIRFWEKFRIKRLTHDLYLLLEIYVKLASKFIESFRLGRSLKLSEDLE